MKNKADIRKLAADLGFKVKAYRKEVVIYFSPQTYVIDGAPAEEVEPLIATEDGKNWYIDYDFEGESGDDGVRAPTEHVLDAVNHFSRVNGFDKSFAREVARLGFTL